MESLPRKLLKLVGTKEKRLSDEKKGRARQRTLARELEWVRMAPKARQAKGKLGWRPTINFSQKQSPAIALKGTPN